MSMCSMEQGTKTTLAVEVWRPVVGWEGLYEVSNHGQVQSIECDTIRYRNGKPLTYHKRGKVIKGKVMPNGYIMVRLHKDGEETNALAHRLVAQAFIPNPDNLPEVNHKDEDTTNNRVDNLEWCSSKYNSNYGVGSLVRYQQKSYRVARIDKDGNILREYPSLLEAARQTGEAIRTIRMQCTKKTKLKSESKKSKLVFYRWKFIE